MDKGWVVLAHKLPGKDLVYKTASSFVKKLSTAYSGYRYDSSTDTVTIAFEEAKLKLTAKAIMGVAANKALPIGTYYVWVITGIAAITIQDDFKLCTLSYATGSALQTNGFTKFNTNILMMYEFVVT